MPPNSKFSRRRLLQALAPLPLLGVPALVGGPSSAAAQTPPATRHHETRWGHGTPPAMEIDLPQLQYAGNWNPRPGAMRELGIELRLRTRLEPRREPSVVNTEDGSLFRTPFLYLAGGDGLAGIDEDAEPRLRRFIDLGGMLVVDDAGGGRERSFRKDAKALFSRVLPGNELRPVATDHVLFRTFYIVENPVGRTQGSLQALGIQDEGRLKVLFLPNDLGGALARDTQGHYRHRCTPGGAVQREWAIRFAINILLYATCTDYKADPAHVETLLRSRRWR